MKKENFVIIGGDKRQKYLKEYLEAEGYECFSYGLFDWDDDTERLKSNILENSKIILPLPATKNDKTVFMPFSKKEVTVSRLLSFLGKGNFVYGGIIKDSLRFQLQEKGIPFDDYYDNSIIEKNALLTAFGTLKILLEHIDYALPKANIAILGYGRVAKETASLLTSLACSVTVFARNPSQRDEAEIKGCKALHLKDLPEYSHLFDIVINTIPQKVIFSNTLQKLRGDCKIMELASAPYGVDFDEARSYGIDVVKAFGLPGKYTPKTAGEIIGKRILQREE